jgi:hypothetical protein
MNGGVKAPLQASAYLTVPMKERLDNKKVIVNNFFIVIMKIQ